MRPHGSPAELEARRRAVALLDKGLGVRAVARQIGCSPISVSRWQVMREAGGPEALRAKPPPRAVAARERAAAAEAPVLKQGSIRSSLPYGKCAVRSMRRGLGP